uniref:Uncharacterized protein n=1 Tax=Apple tombus-like virus 2 TaxID=2709738 RepID=A0A6C0X1B4_9TOMB|nr:MAG: hypothetical protein [Apple tombus-like virus 2]
MATTQSTPRPDNPAYNFVMSIPVETTVDVSAMSVRSDSVRVGEVRPRVGLWMAFKMLFAGYVDPRVQLDAKHALETFDNPDYDEPASHMTSVVLGCANQGEEDGEEVRKPRRDNSSWWTVYSLLAHAEFNAPTFSRANEMVVSTWIRKQMHSDGVTKVDTAKVLGLAVRMAFVPTEADVLALQYSAAPAIRAREDAYRRSYWTAWWGRPVARATS